MLSQRRQAHGFSLIELSIVLLIMALLAGGLLQALGSQREITGIQETRKMLDEAREALLAFAMINGRLPCPARASLSTGQANAGREDCTLGSGHGVLPWLNLGLPETDPWGQRLSYYAQPLFSAALPAGAQSSFTLDAVGNANIKDSSGVSYDIAAELAAVIVSHGSRAAGAYQPNGQQLPGASGDEAENANADLSFVSHSPSPSFDDHLTWISPALLKSRLVAAGRLP